MDEKKTQADSEDEAQSAAAGSDEQIKHSTDQPAEGDPDARTGSGVSSELPVEG